MGLGTQSFGLLEIARDALVDLARERRPERLRDLQADADRTRILRLGLRLLLDGRTALLTELALGRGLDRGGAARETPSRRLLLRCARDVRRHQREKDCPDEDLRPHRSHSE